MTDWWRSWHGAPTDSKWLAIAHRAEVAPFVVSAVAWALFDHASQQPERGTVDNFDTESYAVWAGLPEDDVRRVIAAMESKGIITDGALTAWPRRQPQREDDSTPRVRAFRERRNAVQREETQCNAPDTEEIREELPESADALSSSAIAADAAPRPEKTVPEPDPEHVAIAYHLDQRVHENNPKARTRAGQIRKWTNCVRLMVERDGRTLPEIRAVLDWSQSDPFWQANILSMDALREHFDQLTVKMAAGTARASPNGTRRPGPAQFDPHRPLAPPLTLDEMTPRERALYAGQHPEGERSR